MTLLEALWNNDSNEDMIRASLLDGSLTLTGNFRGHEAEVAADIEED